MDIENITVGIAVFDKNLDKVYLKKRQKEPYKGKYAIPGGKIKESEDIKTAAIRELYEEVGILIFDLIYIDRFKDPDSGCHLFGFALAVDIENLDYLNVSDLDPDKKLELAPNNKQLVLNALEVLKKERQTENDLNHIKNEIIENIAKNIKKIEKKQGWGHHLFVDKIGIIGSAVGLKILCYHKEYVEEKRKVVNTLRSYQKKDGGWGVNNMGNKRSLVESTCECLTALFKYSGKKTVKMGLGIQWLEENRKDDFSWGSTKQCESRIYPTCLAIRALVLIEKEYDPCGSINWLLSIQNQDGGWGFHKEGVSTFSATSEVLILLSEYKDQYKDPIHKALVWIENSIKEKPIINEKEEEYVHGARFVFYHSTLIKILLALINTKKIYYVHDLFVFLQDVIIKRDPKKGFWKYEDSSRFFPIWHTYNIMVLLNCISKSKKISDLTILRDIDSSQRIQKDLLTLIAKKNF